MVNIFNGASFQNSEWDTCFSLHRPVTSSLCGGLISQQIIITSQKIRIGFITCKQIDWALNLQPFILLDIIQYSYSSVFSVIPRIPSIVSIKRKASSSSARLPAPLAGVEEITPSLRSSFASVYYNITPYESMSSSVHSASSNSN